MTDHPGVFLVWGDNTLARRLASELINTYAVPVTVIVRSVDADQAPDIADLEPETGDPDLRPVLVAAARLTPDVLVRAGVTEATAVALVERDDVANVDAAMMVRELNPTARIVVRVFNPILAQGVTAMLGDCDVLSGSEIAAPAFVAAALGDDVPTYVRLTDEFLVTAHRSEQPDPDDVVCGLAVLDGRAEPETLPADAEAADLLLVRRYGEPPRPAPRPARLPLRVTRLVLGRRRLRYALAGVAALLFASTALLAHLRDLNLWEAGYLAVVTALGGIEGEVTGGGVEHVVLVTLALAGVALVPFVTVLVVEAVVTARLALASGALTRPVAGHVVIVGLGNVGTRVLRELHGFGVDVVCVDRSADARGVAVARELGVPVIIANGNSAEALRAASVATARALLVLSTDDVSNLETALLGRALHGGRLRVVLRLYDEAFARRVKRTFDIDLSRSVSYLAAPAFAAALFGREVIDAIPVGRRVLLVAELPVGAGSDLEGRLCPEVDRPNEVRLVAVRTGRIGQTLWTVPQRRRLVRTDRLIVVATRAGLAGLLARTRPNPDAPPLPEPQPLRLLARPADPTSGSDSP
ncbi:Trk K+ transport system, NAD-binding component [Asanoa hainanensis]|uniref:Trk K+ transport system, NAD-binding component n=1 Tax=Asanoa hainanensis TaxID=560556 RepID=A0A239NTQ0_9ACTN|nr:Trk K+ transport system, NAD-binding component [Asanoa hainanensis]